jgi:hypothetical protein
MAAAAALAFTAQAAAAQVGHAPGQSPYRDIGKGHAITLMFGHISGDGGVFGVAPHNGNTYGIRYDIRTGTPIQLGIGFARADLERLIFNPSVAPEDRTNVLVKQAVSFAEFNLAFNLTGGKSWHRLAPFVGGTIGLAFPSLTTEDVSGFDFGHKLYVAPTFGTRIFFTKRLQLRGEARGTFWKVTYPGSFGHAEEWTTSPWLLLGLGYSFSP